MRELETREKRVKRMMEMSASLPSSQLSLSNNELNYPLKSDCERLGTMEKYVLPLIEINIT